jgi:hypothetical protein
MLRAISEEPAKVLEAREEENERKYLARGLEQRRHVSLQCILGLRRLPHKQGSEKLAEDAILALGSKVGEAVLGFV